MGGGWGCEDSVGVFDVVEVVTPVDEERNKVQVSAVFEFLSEV